MEAMEMLLILHRFTYKRQCKNIFSEALPNCLLIVFYRCNARAILLVLNNKGRIVSVLQHFVFRVYPFVVRLS
jgi:hypothetical protein